MLNEYGVDESLYSDAQVEFMRSVICAAAVEDAINNDCVYSAFMNGHAGYSDLDYTDVVLEYTKRFGKYEG